METDIITALRGRNYNIIDSISENLKLYPAGEGCNLILNYNENSNTWEIGDVEKDGEVLEDVPILAKNEIEKFMSVFNETKLDLLENFDDTGSHEGGYHKIKEPDQKWSKPTATRQLVKTKSAPLSMQDKQINDLNIEDIKSYICPQATEQEAFMFLRLCQARNLNPFTNEAYLIKYPGSPAQMVVGKEAYTRRAEQNTLLDGYEAGIIIKNTSDAIEYRQGTFKLAEETLLGGWAKIYRKDRGYPFISEVALDEYIGKKKDGSITSMWKSKPATMIRKVALVQALREAFPSEFSGMYDQAEVGGEVEASF